MADYFKFLPNTQYVVEITGAVVEAQGNYGPQHNWPVKVNGADCIVSQGVGSGLDTALSSGQLGSLFNVIKNPSPTHAGSFVFQVTPGGSVPPQTTTAPQATPPPQDTPKGEANWDMINAVKTWHIDKSVALKLAVELAIANSAKGKATADVVRDAYIKLFGMLTDDTILIVDRLSECKTLDELAVLWTNEGRLWMELLTTHEMEQIGKFKESLKASLTPKQEKQPEAEPFNNENTDAGDLPLPF